MKKAKLIARLRDRPANVRFSELCRAMEAVGFSLRWNEMNHYEMKVFFSKEDRGWIAVAPELPGCSAFGDTPAGAIRELKVAMEGWLAVARKRGNAAPEPIADRDLRGRVLLRLPKSMHRQLLEEASEQGVSLNQYILFCLAGRHPALGRAPHGEASYFIDARGRWQEPKSKRRPGPVIVTERRPRRR